VQEKEEVLDMKSQVSTSLPLWVIEHLRKKRKETGISISEQIRDYVIEAVKRENENEEELLCPRFQGK